MGRVAFGLLSLHCAMSLTTCLFGNWMDSRVMEEGMGCWAYNGLVGGLPG